MNFRSLPRRLRFLVIICALSGMVVLMFLPWLISCSIQHSGSFPGIAQSTILLALFLSIRFLNISLADNLNLNFGLVVIAPSFLIFGAWVIIPHLVAGVIALISKREKPWSIVFNLACDALRVIPAILLYHRTGGECSLSNVTIGVFTSVLLFFAWFIMSDYLLVYLFNVMGENRRGSLPDITPHLVDLSFLPVSLLIAVVYNRLGVSYILMMAIPLVMAIYYYRSGLGRRKENKELRRLNNELFQLSREKTAVYEEMRKKQEKMEKIHLQLLQSEKLASIGRLAAGVAHEINTPLGTILTNAEFALSFIDDEDVRECLSSIKMGAQRCRDITEKLLLYSRREELKRADFSIEFAIENALKEVKANLDEAGIGIDMSVKGDPHTIGIMDDFTRVIINLFLNGKDAILLKGEGGGIITILAAEEMGMVKLSIKDNGAGMKQEIVERIFDPFFTTKDVGKGTGLGLWLSKSIVERMGGKILVKSVPGEGSEFLVRVPSSHPAPSSG